MLFNLANFLRGISKALDFVEEDLFGVPTNHSKRIALIAVRLGREMKMTSKELFDLIALALLHDNGASIKILQDSLRGSTLERQNLAESMKKHCIIGEQNVANFCFMTNPVNIIQYHHENHDGTGFFGKHGDEIPLMSRIIHMADKLDLDCRIKNAADDSSDRDRVITYVKDHEGTDFSPEIADIFILLAEQETFWNELTDKAISQALLRYTPDFSIDNSYREIREMTKTFSKIIDAKSTFTELHSSGLAEKVGKMTTYYGFNEDTAEQLLIAADLHDLGKMAVSNKILDNPGILTDAEFNKIKTHPGVAKICLEEIQGFELIVQWIYQHHEKLDGSGYPQGLTGERLSFESRLLTCLDIYQALTEERPYRKAMDHRAATMALRKMATKNLIDQQIVNDIAQFFQS
ncbi:MAG: HD domain-containing protein [Spirochaetes bacterium]|nr:HD domain-containing protein [Spirochaetota bacterium]